MMARADCNAYRAATDATLKCVKDATSSASDDMPTWASSIRNVSGLGGL